MGQGVLDGDSGDEAAEIEDVVDIEGIDPEEGHEDAESDEGDEAIGSFCLLDRIVPLPGDDHVAGDLGVYGASSKDAARLPESTEYRFYLTNIDPDALDSQCIAQTYAARWQIEPIFKSPMPTGAWTSEGSAPVDRPWKSLRAPIRHRPKHGSLDTRRRPAVHYSTGHYPLIRLQKHPTCPQELSRSGLTVSTKAG